MNSFSRLFQLANKSSRSIIGLMSGMSMDGVDLAHAEIQGEFPDLKVSIIGTGYRPYNKDLQVRLRNGQVATTSEVSRLNVVVANEFSACVQGYLEENKLKPSDVDVIGSHGQTLFHSTKNDGQISSTLQIGSPSIIAEITGIPTIGNFRVRDVAVGGQGAPLVCLADYVLFRDPSGPIALNNLGSISNVTVVSPHFEGLMAFDTGPANMAIDHFARMVPGNQLGIDHEGSISAQGIVIKDLLSILLDIPFFAKRPPKAAGYGDFGPQRLNEMAKAYLSRRPEDLVRTAVEYSAVTIERAYRAFVLPQYSDLRKIIFSGGGVYNRTLISRISDLMPDMKMEMMASSMADAREALSFAILANETVCGRPGNVLNATGAKRSVVLGEIAL